MYTPWDIFLSYKKIESKFKEKGYRLPKDWEYYWNEKLNRTSREQIQLLTDYFNTKWNSLDLSFYMYCGFKVLGNFSYKNFIDKRIINKYIYKDKQIKREINDMKRSLIDSIKYVKIKNQKLSINDALIEYCLNEENVLTDYISNNISVVLLVLLDRYGYIKFSDFFKSKTPYFLSNYEGVSFELDKHREFYKKIIRS